MPTALSGLRERVMRWRHRTGRRPAGLSAQTPSPLCEALEQRTLLSVSINVTGMPTWQPQGPGPITDADLPGIPNAPVAEPFKPSSSIHRMSTASTSVRSMAAYGILPRASAASTAST